MHTDVAILGAGPAGCAMALRLLRHGAHVVLVEPGNWPGIKPGETLSPGIEPLLRSVGAADALFHDAPLRHAGTCVEWGARRAFIPFGADEHGPWLGFQVARPAFDARLLAAAIAGGALVLQATPIGLVEAQGRVGGVTTTRGVLRASWTVDATGRSRWLARRIGAPILQRSPRLLARYGHAEPGPSFPFLPHLRADAVGWTWMARVAARRAHWLRVTMPKDRPPPMWVPPALADVPRLEPGRGADVTWRIAETLVGAGWLLTGDAAGQLDPSGGHGVLRALMSGIMAAQAILRGSVRAYAEWFREGYEQDAAQMARNYREAHLFGHEA